MSSSDAIECLTDSDGHRVYWFRGERYYSRDAAREARKDYWEEVL